MLPPAGNASRSEQSRAPISARGLALDLVEQRVSVIIISLNARPTWDECDIGLSQWCQRDAPHVT